MAEQPLVSVIINCFNGEKFLKEAIDSVIIQTYQHWELIFWDNQSTDSSSEIVKSYGNHKIRYFYAPEHTILYKARHYAIEKSKGNLIAFLDVDDWWEPNKIEHQVNAFAEDEVGLVCGNFEIHDTDEGNHWQAWRGVMPSGHILNELLNYYHVGLVTLMLRRTAYEELGSFNPQYHIIGDFDLVLRMAESWKIHTLQFVIAHYRLHGDNESVKKKYLEVEELKIWLTESKNRYGSNFLKGLTNFEDKITYLECLYARKKREYRRLIYNIFKLFPSILFIKLLILIFLPATLNKNLSNKYKNSKIYNRYFV